MKGRRLTVQLCALSLSLVAMSMQAEAASPRHSSLVVLLDRSGSMRQADGACVRADAGQLLLEQAVDGDRLSVAAFGDAIQPLTPGFVTVDPSTRRSLLSAFRTCAATDARTDIAAALEYALETAQQVPQEQRRTFPVHVLLLTDGRHDPPAPRAQRSVDDVVGQLQRESVQVHVLALGNGVDRALLTRIARATGGQIAYAREARDLVVGFLSVARLLGRQWLLFDRLVSPGRVSVPLPAWATEYQAVFIPQSGEATLSAPGAEAARRAANYAYLIGPGHAGPVEMQVGGAGRLLVQAPGDLVLNARMPAVAPRDVFFPCAVRLEPTRAGGLGTPAFLGGATVSLRLGADTFALYDDGKHDDGGVSDGAFGGRCRSAGTGALFWSATLAAPVLDPPSASGSIEVLASPLNVRDPGIFSGWLDASLHRTPRVWFDNPTDVQVDGRLEAGTWHLDVAMAPRSSLEARLPFTGAAFATRREPVVLVQEGRTVPLGGVRVRPSWLVPAVLALVGAMVGVLLRWPQSIAGSTLLVTGTHRDGPERSFSAVATIDEGGVPRFSAQAPPPPFDTPGTFRAVPGARQQKTDFVPRAGQVPMFTASIRGRAGMFRLGRNASWRISADGFSVTYTFNRK